MSDVPRGDPLSPRGAAVPFANPRARAAAAGFNDSVIHAEIARDPADRAIPVTHLPIPGADMPFEEWSVG